MDSKKWIATGMVAIALLVGAGVGSAMQSSVQAHAQTTTTATTATTPSTTTGSTNSTGNTGTSVSNPQPSGTFHSNEDPTHEANESAAREAQENAGQVPTVQ